MRRSKYSAASRRISHGAVDLLQLSRRFMRRPFARRVAAFGTLVVFIVATPARAQSHALETRLKAAFVSKFPQFVEWPSLVAADRPSVDVCVGAPDPFGADLEELTAGETLNG